MLKEGRKYRFGVFPLAVKNLEEDRIEQAITGGTGRELKRSTRFTARNRKNRVNIGLSELRGLS